MFCAKVVLIGKTFLFGRALVEKTIFKNKNRFHSVGLSALAFLRHCIMQKELRQSLDPSRDPSFTLAPLLLRNIGI